METQQTLVPFSLPEQGTDALTLQARFDLQVNAIRVYSQNGIPQVEDLTTPFVDGHEKIFMDNTNLLSYFKDNFIQILDDYIQIEEWLKDVTWEWEGRKIHTKNIVPNLLQKDAETIEYLWEVLKDSQIYEWPVRQNHGTIGDNTSDAGYLFLVTKSLIEELNHSLKEDVCKFITKPDSSTKPGAKKKHTKKRQGLIDLETYFSSLLAKNLRDTKRKSILAFQRFIELVTNPNHDLKEVVNNIYNEFDLTVIVDLKEPGKSNFDEVFWDAEILKGFVKYHFKVDLLRQLDNSEFKEFLIKWKHNSYQRPHLIKYLELKRWNFRLFLAALLGIDTNYPELQNLNPRLQLVKNSLHYWDAQSELEDDLLLKLPIVSSFTRSQLDKKALYDISKEVIFLVRATPKLLIDDIIKEVYSKRIIDKMKGKYLSIDDGLKEEIILEVNESIVKELFRRLRTATFGKLNRHQAPDSEINLIKAFNALVDLSVERVFVKEKDRNERVHQEEREEDDDKREKIRKPTNSEWHNLKQSVKRDETELKNLICDKEIDFIDHKSYLRLIELHERICNYKQKFKEWSSYLEKPIDEKDTIPYHIVFDYSIHRNKEDEWGRIETNTKRMFFNYPNSKIDPEQKLKNNYKNILVKIDTDSGLTICKTKSELSYRIAYEKLVRKRPSEEIIKDYFYDGNDILQIEQAKKRLATPLNEGKFLILCDIFEAYYDKCRRHLLNHQAICDELIKICKLKERANLKKGEKVDDDANKMEAVLKYMIGGNAFMEFDGIDRHNLWENIANDFFNKKDFRPNKKSKVDLWQKKLKKGGGLLLYHFLNLSKYQKPVINVEVDKIMELQKIYCNGR